MNEDYSHGLAENKVLILYTLNTVHKGLLNSDLFKIVSAVNDINYFYFKDILEDLVSSKLIGTYTKDNQTFYELTSAGKSSLDLTIDVLPGIVKLKADNVFQKELNNIAEERSITAEYIPESEKDYTVKCKIVENDKTVFEVRIFAGSNEQARMISDNWRNHANEIYPKIIELLNKG